MAFSTTALALAQPSIMALATALNQGLVGTVTTGAPGTNASVGITTGDSPSINFTIPRGAQGVKGDTGNTGNTGAQGPAATITVGTTSTGAAGSGAQVTNSGSANAATFNFVIPKGDKGDTGLKGDTGNTGNTGATGPAPTITTAATTLAPGSSATATTTGSNPYTITFGIPQGAKGDKGDTGPAGANGAGSGTVTSFSFTNGNGFTGTVTSPSSNPTLSLTYNGDAGTLGGNAPSYYTNSSNQSTGTLPAGRLPALTGDITTTAGSAATTLATVNSNVGTFGSASAVPIITTNGKGLVTGVGTAALGTLATQSATLDNDNTLTGNSATALPTQQAVKGYIDSKVQGLAWKQSVRVASVANGALSTAFASGQVVDGVTLATGDRILIKAQTTGSENGIYTVNASGAPTRAVDADTGTKIKLATVTVDEGSQAEWQWTLSNNGTITLGTTALVFVTTGGGGRLLVANNLSDLANSGTALTNLGYSTFGKTLISLADMAALTAQVNVFTTTLKGAVPAPATATGRFLRDDATWQVVGGNVREDTITFMGNGVFSHYRATVAETVSLYYQSFGGAPMNWGKSNSDGSNYVGQTQLSSGQSTSISLAAGEILQMSGTQGGYVHVKRTA